MSLAAEQNAEATQFSREPLNLTVADAVWIATALLQKEHGKNYVFPTETIVNQVQLLHLTKGSFRSIWQHVNQHCVANRKPQPNRACILFATGGGNRRLYRRGDKRAEGREGGRTHPAWELLPADYAYLREWYEKEWNGGSDLLEADPLLSSIGIAEGVWDGLDPDAYVASLRQGWEEVR